MILVNENKVLLKGNVPDLLSEITFAIRNLKEVMAKESSEDHAEEMMDKVFKLSKMSKEEVHEELTKAMDEFVKDLVLDEKFMEDFAAFLKERVDK